MNECTRLIPISDLVSRLRATITMHNAGCGDIYPVTIPVCKEAADCIEALEATLKSIGFALGVQPPDEHHARHNLDGALIDCRTRGFDEVCGRTMERVQAQIGKVEDILESVAAGIAK